MNDIHWIAVDWGTTHLRAWAMGAGDKPLAERQSDEGMGRLAPSAFEGALLRLVAPWLADRKAPLPVVAGGMVGARQGWVEAPYRVVPCPPVAPGALVPAPVADPHPRVGIVPGLMQAAPPDVMRGEEVQIAGALRLVPDFDGAICLPGTHSKWAQISAGEVVSFQTHMTGEMFALLSAQSVLRHGMADGWDEAAFDAGVAEGAARPERLLSQLFRIRAEGLLQGLPGAAARARLSGLLIGAEIAAARPWWLGLPVLLIGAGALTALYARALAAEGVAARSLDATDCTLAGLTLAAGTTIGDRT